MKPLVSLTLLLLSAFAFAPAQAQMYKWIGPDGKLNYSDTPPPSNARQVEAKAGNTGTSDSGVSLPYELAQAARNHPVTLYTSDGCTPCNAGRALLNGRGIPFTEKTIKSGEDVVHLRQVSGDAEVPILMIGRNMQKGFEAGAWNNALNAAGYPKSSMLPRNFRNPSPQPAVVANNEEPGQPAPSPQPTEQMGQDVPPPAGNAPPGFRF